jgi:class 3 adenylate cyclase
MTTPLPDGTVTFVFTDIEGSTRLLQELGDDYADVAREHRRIVRETFRARGGSEVDTQGDAFFFSFTRARDAAAAAIDAQKALAEHTWPGGQDVRVRMGLHTGEPNLGDEGYLGMDVVRASRICSAGHGGQILLSETTRALIGSQLPDGTIVHDLGEQELKDIATEHIYELGFDGRPPTLRPLKTEKKSKPKSDFDTRIENYVMRQLEQSLGKDGERPKVPTKLVLGGTALAGVSLLIVAFVVIAVIFLIVKLVS